MEQLRELILTGRYEPGAKLPPERELSKRLGVNRASLREALKKLEHLGLVRIRQGDGTRVQNFMETGGIELVSYLLPLAPTSHPDLIRDTLEFRRIFGREVARLAAQRARAEDIARVRVAAERAEGDVSKSELFDIDFEFYVALTACTGNQVMGLLINTVRDAVRSYTPVLTQLTTPAEAVRAHHRALLAAIEAHDVERAAHIADEYLGRGAERVLSLMASGQLPPPEVRSNGSGRTDIASALAVEEA
ncbi:FadR/GntR family transcriptional regulator [Haliangium ochraceum]|uniref:FadR/GntR family transcriptional regulator n=1 Tax=Haliangium ochraceum TaxID=80816 RepID=UPI0018EFAB34|nr:FadR/GntR family transcriptional regulator [Haliangium ochraceum]